MWFVVCGLRRESETGITNEQSFIYANLLLSDWLFERGLQV